MPDLDIIGRSARPIVLHEMCNWVEHATGRRFRALRELRQGSTSLLGTYWAEWEHFEQQTLGFVA